MPSKNIRPGLVLSALTLSGCLSTAPTLSDGQGDGAVTGAAGGQTAHNPHQQLESCPEPLGTLSVFEDRALPWWSQYQRVAPHLGSTVPVIRLMAQQSGCFVIVERGAALDAMQTERRLMQSGATRRGSRMGQGQIVAADYTLQPSIQFAQKGMGRIGAIAGGMLLGDLGSLVAGSVQSNEAATTLLLIDNRSGVQIAAAVGSAKNYDFALGGALWGSAALSAGGFGNTPEGQLITAAFADSFNQMLQALRRYQTQQVRGGLGKGGTLPVGE